MSDSIHRDAAQRAAAIAMYSRNLFTRLMGDQEKRITPAAMQHYRMVLNQLNDDVAALETIINRMEVL